MVKTKKMDEVRFAKLVKEFNALGELIRAKQDEKQAIADRFDDEVRRFGLGQISQKTLDSSVEKTNKEFSRIDDAIRSAIRQAEALGTQAKKFAAAQSPKKFKAKRTGAVLVVKKKSSGKKAMPKKKVKAAKPKIAKKKVKKAKKKAAPKKKAVKKKVKKSSSKKVKKAKKKAAPKKKR